MIFGAVLVAAGAEVGDEVPVRCDAAGFVASLEVLDEGRHPARLRVRGADDRVRVEVPRDARVPLLLRGT